MVMRAYGTPSLYGYMVTYEWGAYHLMVICAHAAGTGYDWHGFCRRLGRARDVPTFQATENFAALTPTH